MYQRCFQPFDLSCFHCVRTHVSEFDGADGLLQSNEIEPANTTAQHLRFTILKGHDHFISVHQINVLGTAVHN